MNDELQEIGSSPKKEEPKVLRTFESDIASAVKSGTGSALKIALAEQQKLQGKTDEQKIEKRSVFFVVLSVFFLLAAAGAGVYVAYKKNERVALDLSNQTKLVKHPFLNGDRLTTTTLDKILPSSGIRPSLAKTVGSDELSSNTIKIILVEKPAEGTTPASYVKTADLLKKLAPHIPDQLVRTLDPTFALGMYQSDKIEPFIVLKTNSFQYAYSGMLTWEKYFSEDLYDFMGIELPTERMQEDANTQKIEITQEETNSTTTKTTTTTKKQVAPVETVKPEEYRDIALLIDRTIRNRDVRVVQDSNGKIYFVYGFPKSNTILIASSIESYFEVLSRLTI